MHIDPATLDASAVAAYAGPGKMAGPVDFLLDIIPATVVGAFAAGNILQVLLFSLLFGFALQRLGGRSSPVFHFIERLSDVLFAIVGLIMRLAPDRRLRRHGLHHREVRRREPRLAGAADGHLLRDLPRVRLRRAGR